MCLKSHACLIVATVGIKVGRVSGLEWENYRGHFVSRSLNTIAYRFPQAVTGSSIISTLTIWKGRSITIG